MARDIAPELAVSGSSAGLLEDRNFGSHWGMAALLAALGMVSPFSLDTFFPSFAAISREFSLTSWQIQQTITVYMLPFALMTLVHGPLSDALGRRPVVLGGLAVYSAASLACALAPSFGYLLAFRTVQGMSAGVGLAVGRAIIRDLHQGPQAQRLMSTITMIFGIAPAVAPVLGGWIHVWLGWRFVFGFMVAIGAALALMSWLRLPETHPSERRSPFDVRSLGGSLWAVASNRQFMQYALAVGTSWSAMITFVGAAPAIVMNHWHLSETDFAWLFVPLIGGVMGGAWLSGRLAGRVPGQRQIALGFALALAGPGLWVVLQVLAGEPPILLQQVFIATTALGVQLVIPIFALRMLDLFPHARGSAASMQSCVMLGMGALVIGGVVPALSHSMLALTASSLAGVALGFGIWRLTWRVEEEG